jgi:heme/copper-type cytochrome/quinol oxidase subunit 3
VRHRPVQDVSSLPDYGFGSRMTPFWGTLGFMTLEGTGFALTGGAYLYFAFLNPQWPLADKPPDLLWSSLLTAVLLLSAWPNQKAKANARSENLAKLRRDLLLMSLMALAVLALRGFEFTTLNVRWDQNAYGSIVWVLLGLHTAHILTDAIDTFVVTALMFTKHARGRRFSDVEDNAVYWDFVVVTWLPIYGLIYWASRV